MPRCVVPPCPHRTGRKKEYPDVILHPFPKNIHMIKNWLQQTGHDFGDLDAFAQKVLEGKKCDKYRMCSCHFTNDSYMSQGTLTRLKPNAVPSIFNSDVFLQRSRGMSEQPSTSSTIIRVLSRLRTTHTQTDVKVFNREVGTNTESWLFKKDIATQTEPEAIQATTGKRGQKSIVEQDHLYVSQLSPTSKEEQIPQPAKKRRKKKHITHRQSVETHTLYISNETNGDFVASCHDEKEDPLYQPSTSLDIADSFLESNVDKLLAKKPLDYIYERKFFVYESCLDRLLYLIRCQHTLSQPCQSSIIGIRKTIEGSMVRVFLQCMNGHDSLVWSSQPLIGSVCAGNIHLAASVLLSGSSFNKVDEMLKLMFSPFISLATYNKYQQSFLFPAIDYEWSFQKDEIAKELMGKGVVLVGDRLFHNPGHGAKYCIYSLMDIMSKKIVHFNISQICPGKSKVMIEKESLEVCLDKLIGENKDVRVIATDRHIAIRKLMQNKYKNIDHQFDVCHVSKSLFKRLTVASKQSKCQDLAKWITPIINHLWWSARTCGNDSQLLLEKWQSLLYHVTNKHYFPQQLVFPKCQHKKLSQRKCRETTWLEEGTLAYNTLKQIITNPKLLYDIKKLAKFCHSGPLELFHSKVLKYRCQGLYFHINGMYARTILAALSYNRNLMKYPPKKSFLFGEKRCKTVFPKPTKQWITKTICEPFVDKHLFDIMRHTTNIIVGDLQYDCIQNTNEAPINVS